MDDLQRLFARLKTGPVFLLLGQGDLRQSGDDATEAIGPDSLAPADLAAACLAGEPADWVVSNDEALERAPVPEQLAAIAQFRWNGVFTSRIDSSLAAAFQADWRRVTPTAALATGRFPRSPTDLQVRYLFGGLGLPSEEWPPIDEIELVDAQSRASDILKDLATTLLTPRGTILVDGWGLGDWLTPKDLYQLLASRVQPGQLHLFSANAALRHDPLISRALTNGLVDLHAASLKEVLETGDEAGVIELGPDLHAISGKLLPAGSSFIEVGTDTWNQVVGSARPVDLDVLTPFTPASPALQYQRFHTFLGAAEGAPPWKAVASGFKLKRDFEDELLSEVRTAIQNVSDGRPVLLQGQTASGKSLALCWLAQELARSGEVAVLQQSRRGDQPRADDLERFSSWVEAQSGMKTVLIWDGMARPSEYENLQRQLLSRGDRVQLVGSTYLQAKSEQSKRSRYVTAPVAIQPDEARRIQEWLRDFGFDSLGPTATHSSILALLYRILPDTQRGIRQGLSLEMRAAEAGLESLARDRLSTVEPQTTALAAALIDAGMQPQLLTPSDRPHAELAALAYRDRSTAEQLSALILTVGRRGLTIPLALALRAVGRESAGVVIDLFKVFDIFRWTETSDGEQYLGARTTLEADLGAFQDLTRSAEVDVIISIIENIRPRMTSTGGDEVQFLMDLFEVVGPQSATRPFANSYGDFAQAFRRMHENGPTHPRLILLEANLIREYVIRSQREGDLEASERVEVLRYAEDLLERTLYEEGLGSISRRSRLLLKVELASSLGAQLHEATSAKDPASHGTILGLMERVQAAILSAREDDPENYYPIDVLAWTTRDATTANDLDEADQLALLAEAMASLDSVDDATLTGSQLARKASRQAEIAGLIGDELLEESFVAKLIANSDPAAHYLVARRLWKSDDPGGGIEAMNRLLDAPAPVLDDWKCARLLLDIFWQTRVGKPLLGGEKETLAFSQADWRDCLAVVDRIRNTRLFDQYRVDFVRGLAQFHLGRLKESHATFKELGEQDLQNHMRVKSAYLASNEHGGAVEYSGRVRSIWQGGRRGNVWVNELKTEIAFIPLQFGRTSLSAEDVLQGFNIAFNFRGALAVPMQTKRRGSQ